MNLRQSAVMSRELVEEWADTLPIHFARMAAVCVHGDLADPRVVREIKEVCIPRLSQHRRELLAGSYLKRHDRPQGFISAILSKSATIQGALNTAHRRLMTQGPSNVISLFR
ncbi:hypothetical protein LCGC14_0170440 [marine sediment metagenome]|uniref:Uncharacterized protein n=1 Tax=marine sediment metagenome TaxID=412755 RepID=A0A0F9USM6_9ZZZZ